jgi:hypothetical protein
MESKPDPRVQRLGALVGEWTTEATHRLLPGEVVVGRAVFEWLEGERFLVERFQTDHREFPDGIAILGATDPTEELSMHFFDSRGVHRVFATSLDDGVWTFWRDTPGFSQRFTAAISADGDTMSALAELSEDGSTWQGDLRITYRKLNGS